MNIGFFLVVSGRLRGRRKSRQVSESCLDTIDAEHLAGQLAEADVSWLENHNLPSCGPEAGSAGDIIDWAVLRFDGHWSGVLEQWSRDLRATCNFFGGDRQRMLKFSVVRAVRFRCGLASRNEISTVLGNVTSISAVLAANFVIGVRIPIEMTP